MTGATIGKAVAAAVFLGVAGLITLSIVRSRNAPTEDADAGIAAMQAPDGDVTIVDLPTTDAAMSTLLGVGEAPVWRQVDADGNLTAEILADSLEPERAGRIRLIRPRATFPVEDGRIEVRAAEGSIIRRSGGEPESGDLSGGVTITLVQGDPSTPEGERTVGTFSAPTLRFEESRREVSTTDEIVIEGEGLRFRGRGLTVRTGEVANSSAIRLLFLRIQEGGHLEIEPKRLTGALDGDDGAAPGGPGAGAVPDPGAPIEESFYHVLAAQDVNFTWGTATLRGDRVEGAARLVNGAFPADAIRPFPSPPSDSDPNDPGAPGATGAPPGPTPPDLVTLSWVGPMELQLVDTRPGDLAPEFGDDAAVKWIGIGRGAVRAEDPSMGFIAESSEVRYGLTSGRLRMTGKEGVRGVDLTGAELGTLHSHHAEIDLGAMPEIVAWVDGPGTVAPAMKEGEIAPDVAWDERADLTAVRTRSGDVRVTSVSGAGNVRLTAQGWSLTSAFARAIMGARDEKAVLDRVLLRDGFRAVSAATLESVEGADAEIRFARPQAGETRGAPKSVAATGDVRLVREAMRLEADAVSAELVTNAKGDIDVAAAEASGAVRASVAKGVEVRGPRARAERTGDIVSVTGPGSSVTITDDAQTIEIFSESMEVRRAEGSVVAYGPGRAEQRTTGPPDAAPEAASLAWTDGLTYDDATGIAELLGEVTGARTVGTRETNRLSAPGGASVAITPGVLRPESTTKPTILSVVFDGFAQTQAEVEGRLYAPPAPGAERGPLESLIALRSTQIAFDVERERLTTPGAGVLVIEDRRAPASAPASEAPGGAISFESRGTTAFRWNGALTLDRIDGRAQMNGGVRATHVDATSQSITELQADLLSAEFTPGAESAASSAGAGAGPEWLPRTISARDRVRIDHRSYTIECDVLDFDAVANLFTARAGDGARVRALDRARGATIMATEVTIDPRTGNLTADGFSGITSGR